MPNDKSWAAPDKYCQPPRRQVRQSALAPATG